MKPIQISTTLSLDLPKLVDSRMLIAANSGGGKSWMMRLVAEQAAGQVQTIILDPEGEFATLREKFDFLLIGSGGEIPCEVRSAALLARKLLELQASAVVDLYDLKLPDRRRFVRLFLESLMHLPKPLWRPLIVMLDEAHIFCPERSAGESEATQAVIDLMSQGRKRSYCGILATQRFSKLHKDAEAETNNVFVGRSWLDVDQKRAGGVLGMDRAEQQGLRDLAPGEFIAFGPALSSGQVTRFRAGPVQTTHPKAGQRHKLVPPKPSEAVRKIVAELADLPQQAEAELRDVADLRKRIAELERQVKAQPPVPAAKEITVEVPALKEEQLERLERAAASMEAAAEKAGEDAVAIRQALATAFSYKQRPPLAPARTPPVRQTATAATGRASGEASDIGKGERVVLVAVAQHPYGVTREQLSVLTGYKRSSRDAYLQRLRAAGFVREESGQIEATPLGRETLGDSFQPLPTGDDLLQHWLGRLPEGERVVLEIVAAAYPNAIGRDEIGERCGYKRSSRDAYLQRLAARKLVKPQRGGEVRMSEDLAG